METPRTNTARMKNTEAGPVSDKHIKNGKVEVKTKRDNPRERRRRKAKAAKVKTPRRE